MNTYFRTGAVTLLLGLSLTVYHEAKRNDTSAESTASKRKLGFQSDDEFSTYIQKAHFNYTWEGAEPTSGLACERIHTDDVYPENDADIVTTGGSGFGVAGLLVGIERGFITREGGVAYFHQIADYLAKAGRFRGVWPHWVHGPTGKVKPFGQKDNGGDLVESVFLMQGLLCVCQYFKGGNASEKALAVKIDQLWCEMEWIWYLNGQGVSYWYWSPNYTWEMDLPLESYNEYLATHILTASLPTYPIPASVYHNGWACREGIKSDVVAYDLPLILKRNYVEEYGGPLFWAHYFYIGLCSVSLSNRYANYRDLDRNHVLIDYCYCVENPRGSKGYSNTCWGLTASYSVKGYSAHMPSNDHGVITSTAALSSYPYTPEEPSKALKHFYFNLEDSIWGKYGLYDTFNEGENWYSHRYLAIDQCTIAPTVENYRMGLPWCLFMNCPETQDGLKKLGSTIHNARES